jgi:hypothetical protein
VLIYWKISIENNNEQLINELNNINILFHEMKIVKTIIKLTEGYIYTLILDQTHIKQINI